MSKIRVFLLEATNRCQRYLRCYDTESPCTVMGKGYHEAMVRIEDEILIRVADFNGRAYDRPASGTEVEAFDQDARWPTQCECGHKFGTPNRQLFWEKIYRRQDNGAEGTTRDAPVGAVWNSSYLGKHSQGADGRALTVRLPGGRDWVIDARASNCTMPDDTVHRCWVRHGNVEDGTLHVDKNGNTCGAGAGSIAVPGYHGFLHFGHLVEC